jgi:hypothetical protein
MGLVRIGERSIWILSARSDKLKPPNFVVITCFSILTFAAFKNQTAKLAKSLIESWESMIEIT